LPERCRPPLQAAPQTRAAGGRRPLEVRARRRECDAASTADRGRPRALLHSLVDSELLSQGEVLEDERTLASEECGGCDGEYGGHRGTLAVGEKPDGFSRYQVFADNGQAA